MSKRKFSSISCHPFGFDINLANIKVHSKLGPKAHHIENYIEAFEHGRPIFQHPHDVMVVEKKEGMFATIQGKLERTHISTLHTSHTVSLYGLAHYIKTALQKLPHVLLQNKNSSTFKTIDMRQSRQNRGHPDVILNATHMDKLVVLKTTTNPQLQLKYIIEAVIHYQLRSRCPEYFPELHFIGFAKSKGKTQLIVCSEQLKTVSVTSFMHMATTDDKAVLQMVKDVCQALVEIQKKIKFTHRDCHISNIYYDQQHNSVKLIDFDWSCVQQQGRNISVPRYLYDTTRTQYCSNKSVDCCIFLRTLGPMLEKAPLFMEQIYTPLMLRYEKESKELLKKWAITETAAMQLYKLSTDDQTMRGHYSHSHGLNYNPKIFDYIMAYYEWKSMTPQAILDFIHKQVT